MYVWARLARMALTTGRRGDYRMGEEGRLSFRCLPTDIDFNRHLNNARYMMLADVGRIDIFFRTGLIAKARENGWAPMLGGLQIVFMREIRLWRKFDVLSTVETWEGTQIIGRHEFVLDSGETAAVILTAAGIYDRRNRCFIDIDDLFAALGHSTTPRPPTETERIFMASHDSLRRIAKGRPALR